MVKKCILLMILNLIIVSNSWAKYRFKETLNVAKLNTDGNYYLITYTERNDTNERIEKVYKGENHDRDGVVLKDWIMDKRTTIDTIKIKDLSGDIEDLSYLFGGSSEIMVCHYLTKIDLSEFNTKNVRDMQYMFFECIRLKELNISNLDTSKVENMSHMFYYCTSLTELDLKSFNTKLVTEMDYMFNKCYSLTEIKVSSQWTDANASIKNMFKNCGVSGITLYN